jgi:hypothetical protein
MSRAYRIKVKESISQDLSASDEICSDLEILEILPAEVMAELLAGELKGRGFVEKEGKLSRSDEHVTVTIDPKTGEVNVKAEKTEHVDLETEAEGWGYDDVGPKENG